MRIPWLQGEFDPFSAREIRRVADYSRIAITMSKQQHLVLFAIYLQGAT